MEPPASLSLESLRRAGERIRPHVRMTPVRQAPELGLWVKCENRQFTGSFKLRGALNKILGLSVSSRRETLVAASAGNHGLGVAWAARLRQAPATIVVPQGAVQAKVDAIRELGADVLVVEGGYAQAEKLGQQLAQDTSAVWISPYNDLEVIAGQGTIGLEVAEQLELASEEGEGWQVFVPVGGGGLICGVAAALKRLSPRARLIGVQTTNSPHLHAYFHGGDMKRVVERPTLADGLAGGVEAEAVTLELVRALVDDFVLVDELAIENAIRWADKRLGEVIEPSAAAALAACLGQPETGRRLVILSGGNIAPSLLARVRGEGMRDD